MTSNLKKCQKIYIVSTKKFGLRRHDRDTRLQLAQNFRAMYRSLGMDLHGCAQFLHVLTRTVHNRESGKHDIPYATYRLMRLLSRMKLLARYSGQDVGLSRCLCFIQG
ncbi:hypothetical protein P245_17420 [Comamonas thiooxydans]|uniref:Uncharacterized protein n=1 Tax=Comamonas thiooxydans TaxID=363952 RepID=A0A0E3BBS2_9BURK|nr:hypothetical protein P245_17420 [Comamonas thiooxydans]